VIVGTGAIGTPTLPAPNYRCGGWASRSPTKAAALGPAASDAPAFYGRMTDASAGADACARCLPNSIGPP